MSNLQVDQTLTVLADAAEAGLYPTLTLYTAGATITGSAVPFDEWMQRTETTLSDNLPNYPADVVALLQRIAEANPMSLIAQANPDERDENGHPVPFKPFENPAIYFDEATITRPDGTTHTAHGLRVLTANVTTWHLTEPS